MKALLVVDIQNDFCPGGALAVPQGDTIIPVINELGRHFDHVFLTQDWHPKGHLSFASAHKGKEPFDSVQLEYGEQILWPEHCIRGTIGAEFHTDLYLERAELIIRKGFHKEIDSYSSFFENDHQTPTGLAGYLRERRIDTLYICGLATDFCVHWSAVDGIKQGLDIHVILDAARGIDTNGSMEHAMQEMRKAGVRFTTSDEILGLKAR